jgi:GNAT superfamily N-acetyltransferase
VQTATVQVRRCEDAADEERTLAIFNAVWPLQAISTTEVDFFKASMLAYGDFLGFAGEDPVGSVAVALAPRRPAIGLVFLTVLPAGRGQGVGSALYRSASDWLRERGIAELEAPANGEDDANLAFAERRGFVEVGRDSYALLDLTGYEPPPVDPPPGIEIVSWAERPELARGIYEVACEASPDVPGEPETDLEPFEDWLAHEMLGPGDLAEATFLALAGDEVVGYAKFSLTRARPTHAAHDMTGVKRTWRRRGIAGALKRAQIAWAKQVGYTLLHTQNELRNEPIRRLNERLGYRFAPGRVYMRGPLAPE